MVLLFLDHYSKNYPYTKAFHFIRLLKKDLFLVIILLFLSIFSSRVRVMVFSTTFNNISVISWWSVLLVEDTGVGFKLTTLVVIGTDCIGSYKSNYHNDHDHDSTFFFNYIYKVWRIDNSLHTYLFHFNDYEQRNSKTNLLLKLYQIILSLYIKNWGPGWVNELGSWITLQLIQAYHQ